MMGRSKPPEEVMTIKGGSVSEYAGMLALMRWRKDKVLYNFESDVAMEIMEQTDDPDRTFPLSLMRQLPYPYKNFRRPLISLYNRRIDASFSHFCP